MLEQGEGVRSAAPEEEEAADELTAATTPCTPVPLAGGDGKFGSKVEPGKKRGVEQKVFLRFQITSHYPALV